VVGLCSGRRGPPEPAPPTNRPAPPANGCCFISWSLFMTRLSRDIALWMLSEQYLQPLKPWMRDVDLLANTTASSTAITPGLFLSVWNSCVLTPLTCGCRTCPYTAIQCLQQRERESAEGKMWDGKSSPIFHVHFRKMFCKMCGYFK
jgi:hypothetical protein